MAGVEDLSGRLKDVWHALRHDPDQQAAIETCRDVVATLERRADDLSDLGPLSPQPAATRDVLAHRKGAVNALYDNLRALAERVQTTQVEELQRETNIASFFSADYSALSRNGGASASSFGSRRTPPPPPLEQQLPSEAPAADEWKAEAAELLSMYETDLDTIQEADMKIQEIAGLCGILAEKVVNQQEMVVSINADVDAGVDNVTRGEEHLKRALENRSSYRFYVVCWFLGAALFLLVFDFVDARWSPI